MFQACCVSLMLLIEQFKSSQGDISQLQPKTTSLTSVCLASSKMKSHPVPKSWELLCTRNVRTYPQGLFMPKYVHFSWRQMTFNVFQNSDK